MTDRRTDNRGKNNMSPNPKGGGGGEHNYIQITCTSADPGENMSKVSKRQV